MRPFRLTGIGTFDALFRAGRRLDGDYLELVAAPAQQQPGRVGLVVPKKVLPLAVDRNRVRRILRAAHVAARPAILEHDVILRLKRGFAPPETGAIAADAARLLASLGGERGAR